MKKYLSVISILIPFLACKSHQSLQESKAVYLPTPIDYCKILDSVSALPEFDYSLVKANTKIKFVPFRALAEGDTMVNEWRKQGYRVSIITRSQLSSMSLYEIDSIQYVARIPHETRTVFAQKFSDSIFLATGKRAEQHILDSLLHRRLANERCWEYRQ